MSCSNIDRKDRTVVISQPMFIPWIGLFEQIKKADVFIHYDDVQFPLGRSFMNRVQIKTSKGVIWLTAPIDRKRSSKLINETHFCSSKEWRCRHLETIRHAFTKSLYADKAILLSKEIYDLPFNNLAEFNIASIELISLKLGMKKKLFLRSSELGITGNSTQRLLDLCVYAGATKYITGWGARNYLKHELFEEAMIKVDYMNYKNLPYSQLYGDFTPYVSILDLVANLGSEAEKHIGSETIYWKDFIKDKTEKIQY